MLVQDYLNKQKVFNPQATRKEMRLTREEFDKDAKSGDLRIMEEELDLYRARLENDPDNNYLNKMVNFLRRTYNKGLDEYYKGIKGKLNGPEQDDKGVELDVIGEEMPEELPEEVPEEVIVEEPVEEEIEVEEPVDVEAELEAEIEEEMSNRDEEEMQDLLNAEEGGIPGVRDGTGPRGGTEECPFTEEVEEEPKLDEPGQLDEPFKLDEPGVADKPDKLDEPGEAEEI